MGFDKNESGPIIQVSKKTTKVNLVMVGAVLIFLILGASAIYLLKANHGHF